MMTPNELDTAIDFLELEESRRVCCDPYDCMCHELCSMEDDVANKCFSCQMAANLLSQLRHFTAEEWTFAEGAKESRERDLNAYRREMARDLESIGDYLGADRVYGYDEEV